MPKSRQKRSVSSRSRKKGNSGPTRFIVTGVGLILGFSILWTFHGTILAKIISGKTDAQTGTAMAMSSLSFSPLKRSWHARDFVLSDSRNPGERLIEVNSFSLVPHVAGGTKDQESAAADYKYERIEAKGVTVYASARTAKLLSALKDVDLTPDKKPGQPDPFSFRKAEFEVVSIPVDIPIPGMGAKNSLKSPIKIEIEDVHSLPVLVLRLIQESLENAGLPGNFLYSR